MNLFIDAKELSALSGFNERKAARTIQEANRRIKSSGGIAVKGKAPRKMIEQLLFIDLSGGKDGKTE